MFDCLIIQEFRQLSLLSTAAVSSTAAPQTEFVGNTAELIPRKADYLFNLKCCNLTDQHCRSDQSLTSGYLSSSSLSLSTCSVISPRSMSRSRSPSRERV